MLAGHVISRGFTTAIYDVNVHGWDESVGKELLSIHNPKLIIVMVYGHHPSASTQTMPAASKIVRDIKSCNQSIPIALGGTHPSALPERTLDEETIDFVIQGEGVYTISDYLDYLHNDLPLKRVRGLWMVENGKPVLCEQPEYISDLDGMLPNYPWELLGNLGNYRAHNMHCFQDFIHSVMPDFSDVRTPYVAMNTSIGCPYSCHYCCTNAIFNKPGIRYWSINKVLLWLDDLVLNHNVRNIRFDDELFLLSSNRVDEFCSRVIERGYDLNLSVYGRVDTIHESLLEKMKTAGINWVSLGIESGNAEVRASANKKINHDIEKVVHSIQNHGINVIGNYMFGLPTDTLETMQQTLDLAVKLNTEYVNFYTVMAYPGSQLYSDSVDKSGWLPDNWEGYSQLGAEAKPLPSSHLSSSEILEFRDNALHKYFDRNEYREMITEKFGSCVNMHLDRMLQVRIVRKLL